MVISWSWFGPESCTGGKSEQQRTYLHGPVALASLSLCDCRLGLAPSRRRKERGRRSSGGETGMACSLGSSISQALLWRAVPRSIVVRQVKEKCAMPKQRRPDKCVAGAVRTLRAMGGATALYLLGFFSRPLAATTNVLEVCHPKQHLPHRGCCLLALRGWRLFPLLLLRRPPVCYGAKPLPKPRNRVIKPANPGDNIVK